MLIKDIIKNEIEEALKSLEYFDDSLSVNVEHSKLKDIGDYSTNIAMILASKLKKNPLKISETVKSKIKLEPVFKEINVSKPGFINFILNPEYLAKGIFDIIEDTDNYGKNDYGKGKKYLIEFVSANPTGPLNVVNARAAAVGEAICNLLRMSGFTVDKEFYINDTGTQIKKFGSSVKLRYDELNGEKIEFPDLYYKGDYVIDIAKELLNEKKEEIDSLKGEELKKYFEDKAKEIIIRWQKKTLTEYGVEFNRWFSENNELHLTGLVNDTFSLLEQKNLTYKKDGAVWLRTEEMGDDKDRVLIREDGTPTYFLADIAYHKNKFDRNYDYLLDLWGPDHHAHIKRTKLALAASGLNSDNFEVLIIQQVNFLQKGIESKMSKRAGNFVTLTELMHEIPLDAVKFFFLMRKSDTHLDFDIDLAKKESDENPVYYIQYAHARISSIIRNVAEQYESIGCPDKLDLLISEYEINLMKKILEFRDEILNSALSLQPHRITNYLRELAGVFHVFYTNCRIIGAETQEIMEQRYVLIKTVRIILKNGLRVLGISAPEKM